MKGNAILFRSFIDLSNRQFVIPVYQRNYDWLISNCDQLLNDLIKLRYSESRHFFGSIVTAPADEYGNNRFVIDGQQRITTISLLLLAGIRAVNDGLLDCLNGRKIQEAKDAFLTAPYCDSDRIIKLVPIENDMKAFDRVFKRVFDQGYNNDKEPLIESSKLTRNYYHFYQLITNSVCFQSFDELLNTINRLEIISIELSKDDDAQLIFESLNSTGLALTGADKVRNYLLMSLSAKDQQYCFKNYWQKIEVATNGEPTMFLRDYLTIRLELQTPVRIPSIYQEWKKYMEHRNRKEEMQQMMTYANYYQKLTTCQMGTKRLSDKIRHISNLETDIINVFFVQFLKYSEEHHLPEEELLKVIDLIENYWARRIICGLPSNALTKVFCVLHKDVEKSLKEYASNGEPDKYTYSEVLTYQLLRRNGKSQFPRDNDFKSAVKTRDVYHMQKPFQIFLFERLENAIPGEYNDVARELKEGTATIEHIMPQTLNADWIAMLGEAHEEIKENYLHTFANLTLTGINSRLSNKAFSVKCKGDGQDNSGYINTKYRLTRRVTLCDKWTEKELIGRSQEITDRLLKLYPFPVTNFKPWPKPMDEVTLDDEEFSPANRLLKGFRLFGKEYAETSWKGMMFKVVQIVFERFPDEVDSLYRINNGNGSYFKTEEYVSDRYCTKVEGNRYVWTTMGNVNKLMLLRYLFNSCNIAETELVLLMEKKRV